jgi:hypothetical protein
VEYSGPVKEDGYGKAGIALGSAVINKPLPKISYLLGVRRSRVVVDLVRMEPSVRNKSLNTRKEHWAYYFRHMAG